MDFFEAQALARKRTSRLVVLFVLAVIGTMVAGYAAALGIQALVYSPEIRDVGLPTPGSSDWFWQPRLLLAVCVGTILVVGLASLGKWASFSQGGASVAQMLGGRKVSPDTTDLKERQLLNIVEEMAIASGTPCPKTFILPEDESINAFAAGLTTHDAVVAVTRGTLESLTRDELQAVIGHEFSHILNGDMRLNIRLASILFGILFIGLIGQGMLRGMRFMSFSGGRSRKDGNNGVVLVLLAVAVATLVIGYIGYFFGRLIQSAVSRQREYLADASAVQFTRNPDAIVGALKKIGAQSVSPKLTSPKAAQINHSFFSQAFLSSMGGGFATHPPLVDRIRAVDPNFDGKFPPITRPPSPPPKAPPPLPKRNPSIGIDPTMMGARRVLDPAGLLATIGVLNAAGTDHARAVLDRIGDDLRDTVRRPDQAAPLMLALLLDDAEAARRHQLSLLPHNVAALTETAFAKLSGLAVDTKLPLAQLALPALAQLTPASQDLIITHLDTLAQADRRITPFEFSLRRILVRGLRVARAPAKSGNQIYSFTALAGPLSTLMSTLAHAGAENPDTAAVAFAASHAQLPHLEADALRFIKEDAIDLEQLDSALDRLAQAAPPIKERIVAAACAVIAADKAVRLPEIELLRAVCAALDCPMPPVNLTA